MGRTICCTNHCSACGSHFSSVGAFDSHRAGRPHDRYCIEPADIQDKDGDPRLAPRTTEGECRMYADVKRGVTVWAFADGLDRGWSGPERLGASA